MKMKMKMPTIAIVLSVIAIIGGLLFNIEECLWNDSANIKNLVVTISYMSIWGFLLSCATKNQKILIYFLVFWILTFVVSIAAAFIQTGLIEFSLIEFSWGWFFAPFLVPFYGILYLSDNFVSMSIVIALISFGMFAVGIILFRQHRGVVAQASEDEKYAERK